MVHQLCMEILFQWWIEFNYGDSKRSINGRRTLSRLSTSSPLTSMEKHRDFRYANGWNEFILKLLGCWPQKNAVGFKRYHGLLNAIVVLSLLTIPRLVAITFFWRDIDAVIQCFSTHTPFALGITKLIILHVKQEALGGFLETMKNDWSNPKSKEHYGRMMDMATIGRHIALISGTTVYFAFSLGIVVQKWYNLESLHITNPDPRLALNLFWVAYLPIDTSKTINFFIALLLQLYTSFIGAMAFFIFDSLVAVMIMHICGQLSVLEWELMQLGRSDVKYRFLEFQRNLKVMVQEHERLIRLTADLEQSFNFVLFLSWIGCTFTFCFQGYAIIRLLAKGQLNFFQVCFSITVTVAAISHFFICCWVGDLLISKSTEIGYAFYNSTWYNLSSSDSRSLIMIGYKKLKPLHLTTGKFAVLSLNLFLNVVKASMSYLSMLLAVQGRDVELL